jgi:hypothetical protein
VGCGYPGKGEDVDVRIVDPKTNKIQDPFKVSVTQLF